MEEEVPENKGYTKPGFDGRLHYYKIIAWYIGEISSASFDGRYSQWHRYLRGLLSLVKPFIKPDDGKTLEADLKVIREELLPYDNNVGMTKDNKINISTTIDGRLQKVTDDLYCSAKHMLLPTKDDGENDEYDSEEFFRGSDL